MKAFTLIELLLVFAVIGIITAMGIGAFSSYSRSQVFGSGIAEFTSMLKVARSRAISQVKPAACGTDPLDGYKVNISLSGQNYEQDAVCGGSSYRISQKKLPGEVIFESGPDNILFDVSTGTVSSPGTITVSGYGKTSTVVINSIGNISIQ